MAILITIGLTQFAVDGFTDVTYVDLPNAGKSVTAGKSFGEIESVKATSELYSAVAGEVIESNKALKDTPGLVNTDPYGQGWPDQGQRPQAQDIVGLMSGQDYDKKNG